MSFTADLPKIPGIYRHRWIDHAGRMREQTLFVGYTNARAPLLQGTEPNAYMPRKLKCCPPEGYLHADRLTPEEWGGWWEHMTPNCENAIQGQVRGLGDWVLVPRVPTDAMLRAAQGAWLNDPLRRTTTMWAAMLAAAPQQPAAVDGAMVKRFLEAFQNTPGDEALLRDQEEGK